MIRDFNRFAEMSSVIIANRMNEELNVVKEKVYTRDFIRRINEKSFIDSSKKVCYGLSKAYFSFIKTTEVIF